MLLNGGTLDGERILGPKTVAYMTSDHLGSAVVPGLIICPDRDTALASVLLWGAMLASRRSTALQVTTIGVVRAEQPFG